jgi:hypothetical protein
MRLGERLDVGACGDQGLGARLGGKALEVELVDRPAEAVGIVEDDDAALGRLATEQDAGLPPTASWASSDGSLRSIRTSISVSKHSGRVVHNSRSRSLTKKPIIICQSLHIEKSWQTMTVRNRQSGVGRRRDAETRV